MVKTKHLGAESRGVEARIGLLRETKARKITGCVGKADAGAHGWALKPGTDVAEILATSVAEWLPGGHMDLPAGVRIEASETFAGGAEANLN